MTDSRRQREAEHGRRIAARAGHVWGWGSPAGRVRRARRAAMLARGARLGPGMCALELGCGTGEFTGDLARTGAAVVALDVSPDLLAVASGTGTSAWFLLADATALPFGDASLDAVVGSSILHHLELGPAVAEMRRVLRPGRRACFTEPNLLNPQIAVQKSVPAIKRWAGDSPDETAFFRWSLARAFRAAGFDLVRVEPFDFVHPAIPARLVGIAARAGGALERIPLLREIAGSLFVEAVAR